MSFWFDFCDHEKDHPGSYQGSFKFDGSKYDVYYYLSGHKVAPKTMDICIRYGQEDHEYISAGDIDRVRQTVKNIPTYKLYEMALKMIDEDWGEEHVHYCQGCGTEISCTTTEEEVDRDENIHHTVCHYCREGDRIL